MNGDLLMQGVELMLLGMGIVFSFLTVLVFTLRGMSWLADRLGEPPSPVPAAGAPVDIVADNRQLIAVIATAVARYRASHTA